MNEFIHKSKKVFNGIITKLSEALSTIQGWMLGLLISISYYFAGYRMAITGILIAIFLDACFGIAAAIEQGRFAISELGRASFFKFAVYISIFVLFVTIDKIIGDGVIGTKLTATAISVLICLTEAWSICGNALIINPRFPFLRLFRKALMGEIARKSGMTTEEVGEYLNNTENEPRT